MQRMAHEEAEFERQLQAIFRQEADDHLKVIASVLRLLPGAPDDDRGRLIESIHRETHSLKGAARSAGAADVETICGAFEDLFANVKQGRASRVLSPGGAAELLEIVDDLTGLVGPAPDAPGRIRVSVVLRKLESLMDGAAEQTAPTAGQTAEARTPARHEPALGEKSVSQETVRVAAARLDAVLLDAEDMLAAKLAMNERAAALRELHVVFEHWQRKRAAARSKMRQVQEWLAKSPAQGASAPPAAVRRLCEAMDSEHTLLQPLVHRVRKLTHDADRDRHAIGSMTDRLLDDVKQALMLPCSSSFAGLPRMVRELARELDKEIEFRIDGAELEVERRILDEIKGSLVHLLRNAVDHGIEPPAERVRQGKPRWGSVVLSVTAQEGRWVEFAISDDGRGLDTTAIAAAAVSRGIATEPALRERSEHDIQALILQSGLSTRRAVSSVSGHGLGMAIAIEKADRLGGTLTFSSQSGVGATFRLALPLTLIRFKGLLVGVRGARYMLPLAAVERVQMSTQASVCEVQCQRCARIGGAPIALVELANLLALPPGSESESRADTIPVVVIAAAGQRLACMVDEVMGVQEVLVKRLAPPIDQIPNVVAATVLGNGEVVPILLPAGLVRSAQNGERAETVVAPRAEKRAAQGRVLLIEDSVTSRALLKNILHADGFAVVTAVDGLDGLDKLRSGQFDVIVSDVEMPRMDGFELTSRIRADPDLAQLPVVLVTSLESAADRARGIDVGASAYLVKSRFDQEYLLAAVRRFI